MTTSITVPLDREDISDLRLQVKRVHETGSCSYCNGGNIRCRCPLLKLDEILRRAYEEMNGPVEGRKTLYDIWDTLRIQADNARSRLGLLEVELADKTAEVEDQKSLVAQILKEAEEAFLEWQASMRIGHDQE